MALTRIACTLIPLLTIILYPFTAIAWWNQPHQFIGSLTRVVSLPQKDRSIFRECIKRQAMQEGLTAPDAGRDRAFLFWKLGYAISHQKDSVERAARAHHHASRKYTSARQRGDLNACCEAIFQLSEAIHYLQDSADPTKQLNKCRNRICREISKHVANNLYRDKKKLRRMRIVRDKAKTEMDKIPDAKRIARVLKKNRDYFAGRINALFDRLGDPPSCKMASIRDQRLLSQLEDQVIRVFGFMWAGQDRYLELFVKSSEPQFYRLDLTPANWIRTKNHYGRIANTRDGLLLQGDNWTNGRLKNGRLDGNGVESKRVFNLQNGGDIYVKFAVDGGGKYMGIHSRFFSGAGNKLLTTHHSWAGSVVVPQRTWLFGHLKVEPGGKYESTICSKTYVDNGGSPISRYSGTLKSAQGRVSMQFADNYGGMKANMILGEVLVGVR